MKLSIFGDLFKVFIEFDDCRLNNFHSNTSNIRGVPAFADFRNVGFGLQNYDASRNMNNHNRLPGQESTMFARIAIPLLTLCFLGGDFSQAHSWSSSTQKNIPQPSPQQLIIKLSSSAKIGFDGSTLGPAKIGLAEIDNLNAKYQVKALSPLFGRTKGLPSADRFRNVYLISIAENADIKTMREEYERLPDVEYLEPNYQVDFYDLPDDPLYPHQWALNNTAQAHYHIVSQDGMGNDKMIIVYGVAGADIDGAEVFSNPPDQTITAIVAIIDTGADMDHPDLQGSILTNINEIPANGLDDDNNGYIDDVHGWDFSAGDGVLDIDAEDNDPTDEDGHGTHCAGIVAARANNGIGIAGVTDGCQIMPLKIMPRPLISKIAKAIIYASDNGADVISMSFGMPYRSYLLEDAIDYAHAHGVILCAAAGNSGTEEINYPAGFESTIAVAATNDSNRVCPFSTFGSNIDISAPGLSILSLRADSTDMYYDDEPEVHIIAHQYYLASGTSMSCPFVAAVAGYLREVSPGLSAEKVQEFIQLSADDFVDSSGTRPCLPGWDKYSGYGKINLAQALARAPGIRALISSPYPSQIVSGPVEIFGIADWPDLNNYVIEYGQGIDPAEWYELATSYTPVTDDLLGLWDTEGLCGQYTIRLRVSDSHISRRTVFVADGVVAEITSPSENDSVSNVISIVGDAYSPGFSFLTLEYGEGVSPTTWTELIRRGTPAAGDVIADWIVEGLPEGRYTLRLSVYSGDEIEITDEIGLYVKSRFSGENAWKVNLGDALSIIANYADFDNDGVNEIIIGTSAGIKIFHPDGSPDIDNLMSRIENNFLVPVAVGNLDGDGIDDVVAMGASPPMLYGFLSGAPGAPPFERNLEKEPDVGIFSSEEHDFSRIFLKDINRDGRDEIHLNIVSDNSMLTLLYGSDGQLLARLPSYSEYLPADLDGDGVDEFFIYSQSGGYLRRMNQNGDNRDSLQLDMEGSKFFCKGLSAIDIDNDFTTELLVFGYYEKKGYWLYAFSAHTSGFNLTLMEGWPHELGINDYLVPTVPVFGDIDEDGENEYASTYFDISISYVHVWNLDGSSFVPGNPNGLFAAISKPGILNMLTLADLNNDNNAEVIACANDDLFFTFKVQRVYAWDRTGHILPGFPLITTPQVPLCVTSGYRFSPTIGDINRDGYIDMIMPTADSSLIFVNFADMVYDKCNCPAASWRYNRRLNNNGTMDAECRPIGVDDRPNGTPQQYSLSQNSPNPFNPATAIEFTLSARSHVSLEIYNILGQKVRTLLNEAVAFGEHRIFWQGTDDAGRPVASGIYLYRIKSPEFTDTRKMLLLR